MDYFCSLPFENLFLSYSNTGKIKVQTCRFSSENNHELISSIEESFPTVFSNVRSNMLENKPSSQCSICYAKESVGMQSVKSMIKEAKIDFYSKSKNEINFNPFPTIKNIKGITIVFSNLCNLSCGICSAENSNTYAAEQAKIYNLPAPAKPSSTFWNPYQAELEKLFKQVGFVYFGGGEPMIQPEHYYWLNFLVEHNPNILLRYTTNGTQIKYDSIELEKLWKKFKNVFMVISMDGAEDIFEYNRYGANYKAVVENVKKYRSFGIDVKVRFTISIFTILRLKECYEKLQVDLPGIPIEFHLLINDLEFYAGNLPDDIKNNALERFKKSGSDIDLSCYNILNDCKFDQSLFDIFINRVKKLDAHRGTNFCKLFPELLPYFK